MYKYNKVRLKNLKTKKETAIRRVCKRVPDPVSRQGRAKNVRLLQNRYL